MKIIRLSIFILFLLTFMWSCQDDSQTPQLNETLTVEKARMWFENSISNTNISNIFRVKSSDSTVFDLTPLFNWDLAELDNDSIWSAVELPWDYDNGKVTMTTTEISDYCQNNRTDPEKILHLVILKNRITGNIYGFKMAIIPDLKYMLSKGDEFLSSNYYLNRDSKLTGLVMFYSLDDEFVNGWSYKEGKINGIVNPYNTKFKSKYQKISNMLDLVEIESCYYICVEQGSYMSMYRVECESSYFMVSGGGGGPSDRGGNLGSVSNYNGDYNTGYGGGGSGEGDGGTTTSSTALISSSKFNVSKLKEEEIAFLNSMYKQLQENCVTNFINNAMLGGNMTYGEIKFDNTMIGTAGISQLSGDLLIGNGLDTKFSDFAHEWRHFYQRELNSMKSFGNKTGMMEFENAVYKDIETYKKGSALNLTLFDMDEDYYSWIQVLEQLGISGNSTTIDNYVEWIRRLGTGTVNLTLPTEQTILQQWADMFGQYSTGYSTARGYQYQGVNYQFNALSNLINQLNNCQ